MANMSILYAIEKHPVCNPSNILAAEYGAHMFSVQLDSNTHNGALIKIGEWLSLDLFAEDTATTFTGKIVEKMGNGNYLVMVEDPGDAALVYQVPIGAEEWTNNWKKESNLYNLAGDRVRCYELKKWDRFELSEDGFEGKPVVGATISGVTKKKPTIA